jgi:hypothetical protein
MTACLAASCSVRPLGQATNGTGRLPAALAHSVTPGQGGCPLPHLEHPTLNAWPHAVQLPPWPAMTLNTESPGCHIQAVLRPTGAAG